MKNYYNILGVEESVNEEIIFQAYKTKIAQFNGLPFHTKKMIHEIKNLKEAIYVLGDNNKKAKYDKKLQKFKDYTATTTDIDNTKICERLFSITFM